MAWDWVTFALLGSMGAVLSEAALVANHISTKGRPPWDSRASTAGRKVGPDRYPSFAIYLVSLACKAVVGFGLAGGLTAADQVSGPWAAITLGVTGVTFLTGMSGQVPIGVAAAQRTEDK